MTKRHKWRVTMEEPAHGHRPQICELCAVKRSWTRDGVKADGRTPRYAWGYDTDRGFVVPERVPKCVTRKKTEDVA
jgi:hypothetical protein